ncbi:hypothetical protein R5R35_009400 [Gryllus longicercus]|uniref:Uncharacterized protein n=1 Tax=Gryllus longicercus TaxID=2509291 RepID=A0AAN9VPF4_9ORTH
MIPENYREFIIGDVPRGVEHLSVTIRLAGAAHQLILQETFSLSAANKIRMSKQLFIGLVLAVVTSVHCSLVADATKCSEICECTQPQTDCAYIRYYTSVDCNCCKLCNYEALIKDSDDEVKATLMGVVDQNVDCKNLTLISNVFQIGNFTTCPSTNMNHSSGESEQVTQSTTSINETYLHRNSSEDDVLTILISFVQRENNASEQIFAFKGALNDNLDFFIVNSGKSHCEKCKSLNISSTNRKPHGKVGHSSLLTPSLRLVISILVAFGLFSGFLLYAMKGLFDSCSFLFI